MSEYFVPAGSGEAEFVEKRSSFLGHVSFWSRRAIMRSAIWKNLGSCTSVKPAVEPSENEGTKLRGNPAPWMLTPTPSTVAVLNIQLTPALEWSPINKPQNCRPVRRNRAAG